MLSLVFCGWFQCRLATNPDPTDEPRGVSGYTFALGREPDLDRIIRLHDPVAHRSHAPTVGVDVVGIRVRNRLAPDHPLTGARVELLDAPRFESRNRILSDDRAGTGPIHPLHLRLKSNAACIDIEDLLHPPDPRCSLVDAPIEALNRRAPVHLDGFRLDENRIRRATGMSAPLEHRRRRRELLEQDLADESDPLERATLEKRIAELSIENPTDHRVLMLRALQFRRLHLQGPTRVEGLDVEAGSGWPLEFWMGGWDADGLCGYLEGTLHIPLRDRPPNIRAGWPDEQAGRPEARTGRPEARAGRSQAEPGREETDAAPPETAPPET